MGRSKEQGFNRGIVDPEFLNAIEKMSEKPQRGIEYTGDSFTDSLSKIYRSTPAPRVDVWGRRNASAKEVRDVIEGQS